MCCIGDTNSVGPKGIELMGTEQVLLGGLPKELVLEIFSYIKSELATCALVSRQWKELAYDTSLYPEGVFDKKQWKKFIGNPGKQPHLSLEIHKYYDKEKHLLTFIPKTVDGKALTMNSIGDLVSNSKLEHATKYDFVWDNIRKEHGEKPNAKEHWLLLRKDVFPESRNKCYTTQQKIVAAHGLEVPELLGTIVSVFMRYVSKGERVYKIEEKNALSTFTRVKGKIDGYQIVVGGFSAAGLNVDSRFYDVGHFGVAGARKSFGTPGSRLLDYLVFVKSLWCLRVCMTQAKN